MHLTGRCTVLLCPMGNNFPFSALPRGVFHAGRAQPHSPERSMAKISIDFVSDVACRVVRGGPGRPAGRDRAAARRGRGRTAFPALRTEPRHAQGRTEHHRAPDGQVRLRPRAHPGQPQGDQRARGRRRHADAWPTTTAPTTPSTRIGCCIGPGCRIPPCRSRLKRLLAAYHDDNLDTSDAEVLARAAAGRHRPGRGAGARGAGVRPLCRCGQDRGSAMARSRHHVGAVGDPQRQVYLVSGGQPTDVFRQALRQVAQEG